MGMYQIIDLDRERPLPAKFPMDSLKEPTLFHVKTSVKQTVVTIVHATQLHTKIRGEPPLPLAWGARIPQ